MTKKRSMHDFKGIGYSKIGYFREVRSKINELEDLNIELNRRHNKLEAIFNSMSDGLTILDRNLIIVSANEVQRKKFSGKPIVGEKCYSVFYDKKTPCRICPARKTLETGMDGRGETLVKRGRYAGRYFEWAMSPILDQCGSVDEIILVMNDITEKKEYDFKLMQADRMAAIGFLAAGIAHEINNPLTSIAGFSEGLLKRLKRNKESLSTEKMLKSFQEYLEIIHSEAYRCKDIIRNLLDYSRKTGDGFQVLPIDIVIRETMSLIRQHAKDNQIKTIFNNHLPSNHCSVLGNEAQLKHVFLNLFNRCFRCMAEGGELLIETDTVEDEIEILIFEDRIDCEFDSSSENDGCFQDKPEKIVEEEYTLSMSVCYNIIKQHNGDIRFPEDKNAPVRYALRFPMA